MAQNSKASGAVGSGTTSTLSPSPRVDTSFAPRILTPSEFDSLLRDAARTLEELRRIRASKEVAVN